MLKEDAKISCGAFHKREPVIKDITAEINSAKDILEKVEFAKKLQEQVDVIFSCPDYDGKNTDCKNCRFIANVRKRTADLIIKAKKLVQ